jgi:hypothetical protein
MELKVAAIEVEREPVKTATKGDHFSMPVPGVIRRSDKLYKLVDVPHPEQQ